ERLARERRLGDPELGLAALREERGDRDLRAAFEQPVGVDRPPAEARRDVFGQRRLPRAHEADQREVAVERVQRHAYAQSMRSRYAACAATKSPIASPPNLSFAATA